MSGAGHPAGVGSVVEVLELELSAVDVVEPLVLVVTLALATVSDVVLSPAPGWEQAATRSPRSAHTEGDELCTHPYGALERLVQASATARSGRYCEFRLIVGPVPRDR